MSGKIPRENIVEFLSDSDIQATLSKVLKSSGTDDIAVAYWGAHAASTLGINAMKGKVRIICDAYSGACNPDELEWLFGMNQVELKTIGDLHAKVFLTSTSVIVGSANASANGLGQEGEEAGNIEAAALITEQNCIDQARSWFDLIWEKKDSQEVTADVIREVRPLWQERRRGKPRVGHMISTSIFQISSTTQNGLEIERYVWWHMKELRHRRPL